MKSLIEKVQFLNQNKEIFVISLILSFSILFGFFKWFYSERLAELNEEIIRLEKNKNTFKDLILNPEPVPGIINENSGTTDYATFLMEEAKKLQ